MRYLTLSLLALWGLAFCDGDTLFLEFVHEYLHAKYKEVSDTYIIVRSESGLLYVVSNGRIISSFPVSWSYYGLGNREGSFKTPTGLHKIKKKIGDGVPPGGEIKNGKFSGTILQEYCPSNPLEKIEITSRVLILEGTEYGINKGEGVDSYKRKIWIHGTPQTCHLGKPASHGCIRLSQIQIIDLYEMVNEGTSVFIY